jgi:hypothetical protein
LFGSESLFNRSGVAVVGFALMFCSKKMAKVLIKKPGFCQKPGFWVWWEAMSSLSLPLISSCNKQPPYKNKKVKKGMRVKSTVLRLRLNC